MIDMIDEATLVMETVLVNKLLDVVAQLVSLCDQVVLRWNEIQKPK